MFLKVSTFIPQEEIQGDAITVLKSAGGMRSTHIASGCPNIRWRARDRKSPCTCYAMGVTSVRALIWLGRCCLSATSVLRALVVLVAISQSHNK